MLNHLIRGLLFHYKKVLFCFNFIWKGCFKKMHHQLFFRVRANDVNSTKSQPMIFIWWINKMTSDKRWQAKFSGIVLRWKQFLSFKNCHCVSICSVQNRSNRDTTVYYRLIFCAFSWPNMVKWRNSGIISDIILQSGHDIGWSLGIYSNFSGSNMISISVLIPICYMLYGNMFRGT